MKNLVCSFLIPMALFVAVVFPSKAFAERGERHPEIHEAIHALENAKHDFGGHRQEALEACERAIRQLRLALGADKK